MKKLILSIIFLCFIISCGNNEPNTIHIYAALGQSNMVGQGGVDPIERTINNRIMYLDLTNQLQIIEDDLYSESSDYPIIQNLDTYSCAISFADEMIQHVNANDEIVIVPCAFGKTGIDWQLAFWEEYVERINYVLNNYPNSVFEGIIFWQGEGNIKSPSEWKSGMLELLNKIETDYGNVEFVFAQLGNNLSDDPDILDLWENFKIEQQNFSIEHNIKMIYTDDLEMFDHIHVSSNGLKIAGYRFANEFIK
jgi:hypothetical protein